MLEVYCWLLRDTVHYHYLSFLIIVTYSTDQLLFLFLNTNLLVYENFNNSLFNIYLIVIGN